MRENRQRIKDVTERIKDILAPVTFIVPLNGALSVALCAEAMKVGTKPETIIAEAVRAYMGDGS